MSTPPSRSSNPTASSDDGDLQWHSITDLGVRGQGWQDEPRHAPYDRFPTSLQEQVTPQLWELGTWSAGLYVDFFTDASEIFVRWTAADPVSRHVEAFMTSCASAGMDVYGRDYSGVWRWVGGKEAWRQGSCDGRLHRLPLDGAMREYRLYLPLMRQVLSCELGCARPLLSSAKDLRRPLAYYGTSIVHGAGVGRAGMPHAAQLGRALDWEVFNLGVCGRAFCEIPIAEALARLDPMLYIIDVLPNNSPEELLQRLPAFIQVLRQARPSTPIVCIGDRVFGDAAFLPQRCQSFLAKNRALQQVLDQARSEGVQHLYHLQHANWFGADGEGTNDGSHPNDLGAWRMAQALHPQLATILAAVS